MPVYSNVTVGFPAKVAGNEAEDEWQEVDWVTWTTGDLTVDDDFLLVFKPQSSSSGVKSKPLGNLLRAATVGSDEDRTLVVTTSDSLHRVYRFTFEAPSQAAEFGDIARNAEATAAAAESQASEKKPEAAESTSRLEASIKSKMEGRAPLVFTCVELYGPDPNDSSAGSEVLLGRGALALVDPPAEGNVVGTYELLFFSEEEVVNPSSPAQKFVIGPKTVLGQQRSEEDGAACCELKSASATHMIRFDDASVATEFARDYRVRHRVMELASKTAKGRQAASDLKGEIADLKRQSLSARIMRFLSLVVTLLLLAAVVRLATLYSEDPRRAPKDYAAALVTDASSLAKLSRKSVFATTSKVCQVAMGLGGVVPAAEIQQCLALESSAEAARCVENMMGW